MTNILMIISLNSPFGSSGCTWNIVNSYPPCFVLVRLLNPMTLTFSGLSHILMSLPPSDMYHFQASSLFFSIYGGWNASQSDFHFTFLD